MGWVEHIHPYLAELDYENPFVKLKCIGLFFLLLCGLYHMSASIFWSISKTYRSLGQKKKAYWNMSVVRALFGFYSTLIGIWVIFYDTELVKNPVLYTNPTSYFSVLTAVGFFVFECGSLLVFGLYKNITILLSIHHWSSLFGFLIIASSDQGHYFGLLFLLLEMSAPYSSICWILMKAGKGHSPVWKANQFVLLHAFHLRSVVECYLCYQVYRSWGLLLPVVSTFAIAVLVVQVALFTFIMTPYWLYRRTEQMFIVVDWNFKEIDTREEMNGRLKKHS